MSASGPRFAARMAGRRFIFDAGEAKLSPQTPNSPCCLCDTSGARVSHGAHSTGLADHEDGFVDFNFCSSKGCSYPCPVGRLAGNVLVWLREVRIAHKIAGDGLVTRTDANGSVTLPAFVVVTYTAHAKTNVLHPNSYEHFCAQPVRIEQTAAITGIVLNLSIKGEDVCRDLNR
jgi:hypothetical protein